MLSRLMTRREQFVIAFLAASIAVGAVSLYVTQRNAAEPSSLVFQSEPAAGDAEETVPAAAGDPPGDEPPTAAQPPSVVPEIVVSIQGAVQRPGVYTLSEGSRVQDLINAAGGLVPGSETANVNLAARLIDGTTLTVPDAASARSAEEQAAPASPNPAAYTVTGQGLPVASSGTVSGSPALSGGRIDINHATQAELESLPGIGPVLAARIIQYRNVQPFRTVQQLTEVRGIGPKTLEDIRPRIAVH